jgi:hypothetical protein
MGRKLPTQRQESMRKSIETNHGLWVRNDIWANLKHHALKNGTTMKSIVNKALYDYLIREKIEIKTGMVCPYEETILDTRRGTLRKDEADSYIKES